MLREPPPPRTEEVDQVDCVFDVVVLFFLNLLEVDQVFLVGLVDLVDLVGLDVLVELVLFFVVSFGSSDFADDSVELIFFFELVEVVICFELMFLSVTNVLDDLVTVVGVGWLVVEINGKRSLGLDKLVIFNCYLGYTDRQIGVSIVCS